MIWFVGMLHDLVVFTEWIFLSYFVLMNAGYLTLNVLSIITLRRYMPSKVMDSLPQLYSGMEFPVSIIVPAYNEEATIVGAIQSMLQLDYPEFEVIIVNDGSKDGTLDVLKREFVLVPFPEAYRTRLDTKPTHGMFQSTRYSNLRVIDKENGGKADSLNAGINASRYPLFCGVDADTVLQRDSMLRIVYPFLEDGRVVATGGTVRIANGCIISGGQLVEVGLPRNLLALFQVVEYLRAFLFGRLGWSSINGLLIISGAFGLFRKETVIEVGGYRSNTIGEDMELVVRMHRLLRQKNQVYRMIFLPDPVAWTEAPEDLKTLKNQRIRWQRGLAESLSSNLGLMFSRNGGPPGWLAFPFMTIFEWLGPFIELFGIIIMALLALFGTISWEAFWVLIFVAVGFGLLLSISGLLLEEMSFHLYKGTRHLLMLLMAVLLENIGYRQLNSVWRVIGMYQWATGSKSKWGEMKRNAVWVEK